MFGINKDVAGDELKNVLNSLAGSIGKGKFIIDELEKTVKDLVSKKDGLLAEVGKLTDTKNIVLSEISGAKSGWEKYRAEQGDLLDKEKSASNRVLAEVELIRQKTDSFLREAEVKASKVNDELLVVEKLKKQLEEKVAKIKEMAQVV